MAHPVKGSRIMGNMTNDGYHTTTYDAEGRGVSGDGGAYTVTINALGEGVQFWNSAGVGRFRSTSTSRISGSTPSGRLASRH